MSTPLPAPLRSSPVGRESAIGFSIQPPPPNRPWRWIFKILYALAAGVFSAWLVSFTPVESPGPTDVRAANTHTFLYVPNGRALTEALLKHRLSTEFWNDSDAKSALKLESLYEKIRKEHRKLPGLARSLAPFEIESLYPFVGDDFSLSLAPTKLGDNAILVVTRVRGFRGQLARLAAWAGGASGNVQLYDLGGDCIAVAMNGAQPRKTETVFRAASDPKPLALIQWSPPAEAASAPHDWRQHLPQTFLADYDEILPPSVKEALAHPPTVFEMLGQPRPARAELALWLQPDGSFVAAGEAQGNQTSLADAPPLRPAPAAEKSSSADAPYVEALLPISVRHCFLALSAGALAGRPDATRLHKGQRRWTPRFTRLAESGISLDEDLFPAFGDTLQLAIQDAPAEIDTAGYGLCGLRIPFKGDATSRPAFAAAMRAHYTETVEKPGEKSKTIPYLRIHRNPARDRYVEATGQIHAPLWDVSKDRIDAVSDAGPLALMRPEGVQRPEVRFSEPFAAKPEFWYARINGPRVAPTVEKIATADFDDLQQQLGAEEFLKEHPDSAALIKLYGKLAHALGDVSLQLRPLGSPGALRLHFHWNPGTLKGAKEESDEAPPPPPIQ